MTTFKVGDKVRLVGDYWDSTDDIFFEGALKTITGVHQVQGSVRLQLEGDSYFWYITDEFAVELVQPAEELSFRGNRTEIEDLKQRVLRLEKLLRTLYPEVEL